MRDYPASLRQPIAERQTLPQKTKARLAILLMLASSAGVAANKRGKTDTTSAIQSQMNAKP